MLKVKRLFLSLKQKSSFKKCLKSSILRTNLALNPKTRLIKSSKKS